MSADPPTEAASVSAAFSTGPVSTEEPAAVPGAAATPTATRYGVVFWLSATWIAALVFVAVFENWLPIRDPEALGIRTREVEKFESPGLNAWFGGDGQGRDIFARVLVGVRPALILASIVTMLSATIGAAIGVTSAYLRGAVDAVTSVLIDIALAFPVLVLIIAVRASFGNSLLVFVVLFTATGVPSYARIVRGAAFSLSEREFVDAARAMGATNRRILLRELTPNIVLPVLSFAFIGFAIVIIAEGALAFLGLSLDQITWGQLILEGTSEITMHAHVALIPSTVMFLTILSFNLVGDSLRQRFAPREVVTRRQLRTGPAAPPSPDDDAAAVLRIAELSTTLHTGAGDVEAVDGVSLSVKRGEAVGIVGESGSGKTMILRSIVGAFALANVTRSGSIEVQGVDMLRSAPDHVRRVLGTRIGMISQNPLTALNPVRKIESQIIEPMQVHTGLSKKQARARALDLLHAVGIPAPEQRLGEYPHQLSGGMRQRVTIAIALANEPALLLADEPTTALDVTVQDQILRLLAELQQNRQMAMVLVTHDLAVVKGFTDTVAIVYGGQIVESGPTAQMFTESRHHYTRALIASMPDLSLPSQSLLNTIEGSPPPLIKPPHGCRFAERCPAAQAVCVDVAPELSTQGAHSWRCHFPAEVTSAAVELGASIHGG